MHNATALENHEEPLFIATHRVRIDCAYDGSLFSGWAAQPNLVTVLADTAIRGTDLDEARANEARRAAEEALTNAKSKMDLARAHSELAAVTAQIQTIRRYRSR